MEHILILLRVFLQYVGVLGQFSLALPIESVKLLLVFGRKMSRTSENLAPYEFGIFNTSIKIRIRICPKKPLNVFVKACT